MCAPTISLQFFTGGVAGNKTKKVTKIDKREIKPVSLVDIVVVYI